MKPWVKIDDDLPWNRKVRTVPPATRWTYIASICYTGHEQEDGNIPAGALALLDGTPKIARELVAAGLWEVRPDGWYVHDYLEHNRSKAEILSIKERNSANGAKGLATRYRNASHSVGDSVSELSATRPTTRDLSSDLPEGETEGSLEQADHTQKPVARRVASKSLAPKESVPFQQSDRIWAHNTYGHCGAVAEIDSEISDCRDHHRLKGTTVVSWKLTLKTWLNNWANDRELHQAKLAKVNGVPTPESQPREVKAVFTGWPDEVVE